MVTIIIVGMPGVGKDVFVQSALEIGFSKISMGDVVRQYAADMGLGASDSSIGGFATSQRKEHGAAIWAQRTLDAMPKGDVIIDGSRSLDEIASFRESLGSGVKVLAITAPLEIRFRRLVQRGRQDDPSSLEDFERRDRRELSWGLGDAIERADMVLDNSGGIEEFRQHCEAVLRSIMENTPLFD
ncbi:MAG: flagellar hook-basal body complex protein FliE [Candidatus Thermoplasmatota archaeon]|nr:flagellar hook-basal body complex protein FliE [Euryarchaeota archaeon]MBU4032611.1 flagellar hook-basal body complex protein FliE [Candidatus Thermoplasmatota archaeon]MBU4072177.1 flagellar hook-basal body complex protein FliE [Candidatus Thermoplasmatota archaeon]MBU4145021.1 flagellar hook-basal body complex protein FliE [Candidatus Thermoplasmatota archaeon]MBU4592035.1 flagellar hook-basal body complex protein FliE [Candidatus Thermoplasmatota archaeon]